MVATQQLEEKDDMRTVQRGKARREFDMQKEVVKTYAQSCYESFYATGSSPQNVTSNLPQSLLWQFNLKEQTDQPSQHPTHNHPGYSNHVRIHATHNRKHDYHDSSTLCKGCSHFP
jgi:hypothetical protein